MISPKTAPGTKIICADDSDTDKYMIRGIQTIFGGLDGLKKGVVYTVKEIRQDFHLISQFAVVLEEIVRPAADGDAIHTPGYSLGRFNYVVLPKCLTDILASASTPAEKSIKKREKEIV